MSDWDDGRPESAQRLSVGKLVERMTEQLRRIVHTEVELLKIELADRAKAAGIGIAMFVVAAVLGFFALAYLVFAGYLGLAHVFDDWLAALLTVVGLLIIVGALAFVGVKSLKRSKPDTDAIKSRVKQDVTSLKGGSSK
jgi:uncharacterized membrane protein YqjE